jgi:hypothetical protein
LPRRLEEDVVTGKTQHLVAVVTLGEVEGHVSRVSGLSPVRGSNGESESGSKGTANVHGGVEVGNGTKTRWTDRPLVGRLAVFEAHEEVKDLLARVESVLALEQIGTNTDPEHEGPRIFSSPSPSVMKRATSMDVQATFWVFKLLVR